MRDSIYYRDLFDAMREYGVSSFIQGDLKVVMEKAQRVADDPIGNILDFHADHAIDNGVRHEQPRRFGMDIAAARKELSQ